MSGFINGYAAVRIKDKRGIVDTTGRLVVECIYDGASGFINGYAGVRIKDK